MRGRTALVLKTGLCGVAVTAALLGGLLPKGETQRDADVVFGELGRQPGQFYKPRCLAVGPDQSVYVVDKTGRIQVFDHDGNFQRQWRTPAIENGKPCGISFDSQGRLLVADTHYFRVLRYTPEGQLLPGGTLAGASGTGPGEFSFLTRAVEDREGNLYVAEYNDSDRIQKFTASGEFILQFGGHGDSPGRFRRPQSLAIDDRGLLWVADSSNHRIQVFDPSNDAMQLVEIWGRQGDAPGELRYPYDLIVEGDTVYVCELGNHRIQKFTRSGELLGSWGSAQQLTQPWAIARGANGTMFVLDTYNHRVKRIRF